MFGCRTTKILQAGHRLIKLQTCATLQYKGPPIGQRAAGTEAEAQAWEQRQEVQATGRKGGTQSMNHEDRAAGLRQGGL